MQIELKVKSSSAEESGGEEGRGERFRRTVMPSTAKEEEQCMHRQEQGGLSRHKKHGPKRQKWDARTDMEKA